LPIMNYFKKLLLVRKEGGMNVLSPPFP